MWCVSRQAPAVNISGSFPCPGQDPSSTGCVKAAKASPGFARHDLCDPRCFDAPRGPSVGSAGQENELEKSGADLELHLVGCVLDQHSPHDNHEFAHYRAQGGTLGLTLLH